MGAKVAATAQSAALSGIEPQGRRISRELVRERGERFVEVE